MDCCIANTDEACLEVVHVLQPPQKPSVQACYFHKEAVLSTMDPAASKLPPQRPKASPCSTLSQPS